MEIPFSKRVDNILEAGHWKKWDGKEPIHAIIEPESWPEYEEMDPKTGQSKNRRKKKRLAGKI